MRIIESLPQEGLNEYEKPNLEEIEKFIESRVIGQEEAKSKISTEIVSILSGINADRKGPRGSLLMMGPSGTGKSESAFGVISCLLAHSDVPEEDRDPEKWLLKVDCASFSSENQMTSIIGSPPGYVGSSSASGRGGDRYQIPALGIERIRQHTFKLKNGEIIQVVLLDEIEKAHTSLRNFLMPALDKGVTKMADNTLVSFRDTVFLFTSNLGNKEIADAKKDSQVSDDEAAKIRRDALMETFRPEDVSRMSGSSDEAIVFKPLDRATSEKILCKQLKEMEAEFRKNGISLEFQITSGAKDKILDLGVNEETGARALKTVLKKQIYQPLLHPSRAENMRKLGGQTVYVDVSEGGFRFYTQPFSNVLDNPNGNSRGSEGEAADTSSVEPALLRLRRFR